MRRRSIYVDKTTWKYMLCLKSLALGVLFDIVELSNFTAARLIAFSLNFPKQSSSYVNVGSRCNEG